MKSTIRRFRATAGSLIAAGLLVGLAACDDDGPSQPVARGDVSVDVSTVTFADTDPVLGSIEAPVVRVLNQGTGDLTISSVSLGGTGASAFSIESGGVAPFTLSAGEDRDITLAFAPAAEGDFTADLTIASDDPTDGESSVSVTGRGVRFQFAQVDRKGIPALNTVFNHPSGVAGFSKRDYNLASPADDVASYRAQFIVVLDAVGNADSEATADLLLPDELPVNMGAASAFATLTGRAPADDATDVALTVTVGVPGLQSDNVSENDKPFLGQFPFLAAPH